MALFPLTSPQQRQEAQEILAKEVQANMSAEAKFLEWGGKSIGKMSGLANVETTED